MKFKPGLVLAVILILPGWYALIAWTVRDMNHPGATWTEIEKSMGNAVPVFGLPVTTRMLVLLLLAIVGVIVGISTRRGVTSMQRILRTIVIGILIILALSFSFM